MLLIQALHQTRTQAPAPVAPGPVNPSQARAVSPRVFVPRDMPRVSLSYYVQSRDRDTVNLGETLTRDPGALGRTCPVY